MRPPGQFFQRGAIVFPGFRLAGESQAQDSYVGENGTYMYRRILARELEFLTSNVWRFPILHVQRVKNSAFCGGLPVARVLVCVCMCVGAPGPILDFPSPTVLRTEIVPLGLISPNKIPKICPRWEGFREECRPDI